MASFFIETLTDERVDFWIKKAYAAKRRGSASMMMNPYTAIYALENLKSERIKLNKLRERLGETNFSNMLK